MVHEQLISAYYRKAWALRSWGRFGDSAEVVAELLNAFIPIPPPGGTPTVLAPPASLPDLAGAFLLFPTLACDLGQSDRAIPMYDRMIAVLGDQDDIGVRVEVGRARLSKGALLGRKGDLDEAIELCNDVLAEIEASGQSEFRTLQAMALADRGHWLKVAGRKGEAIESFSEVVQRFESGQDEDIDEALRRARAELVA